MSSHNKLCVGCKLLKNFKCFSKNKTKKDGFNGYCKECQKKYREKNKLKNICYQKEYRKNNKDKIRLIDKKYKIKNKKKIKERDRIYREKHKDQIKINHKRWYVENKEYIRQYKNQKYHEKHKHIPQQRLLSSLRARIRIAIGKGKKSAKTMELVGCSLMDLRNHIEKQFVDGMKWENYGVYGWHIDHIRPCSSFDLTDIKQQKRCFHYTNLQPLWAKDNLLKSNKFIG